MAVLLKVKERPVRPRSIKKSLRKVGQIPGVIYGKGIKSQTISIDSQELAKAIREHGQNAVYLLEIEEEQVATLIFSQQQDTFNREWLHVEFLAVDLSEQTELEADVTLVGTPIGVKNGGELTQTLYTMIVSALPGDLPDNIEVDVTHLEIGESITLADLNPKNYDIIGDPGEQVAAVVKSRV